jgi:glycosyltransferase involved in cell wall biosynthesis
VIASNFPSWREIVEQQACGLCVDPLDVAAIAEALRRIVEDPPLAAAMGRAGRAAVHAEYNWPQAERNLLALYSELLGAP